MKDQGREERRKGKGRAIDRFCFLQELWRGEKKKDSEGEDLEGKKSEGNQGNSGIKERP